MIPAGSLPQAQTRVLVALLHLEARGARTTVRSVAAEVGLASSQSCWFQLDKLRSAGLVSWEDGRRGTLRSNVEVLPIGVR